MYKKKFIYETNSERQNYNKDTNCLDWILRELTDFYFIFSYEQRDMKPLGKSNHCCVCL